MLSVVCLYSVLLTCFKAHIPVLADEVSTGDTDLDAYGSNLALKKNVRISHIFHPHDPQHSVDGNLESELSSRCTLTLPNPDGDIWLEVDLGARYSLGDIKILNRKDYSVDEVRNITIDVFEHKEEARMKKLCTTYIGPMSKGWFSLSCDSPVSGRFIRITKEKRKKNDYLAVCEVEVYERRDQIFMIMQHTRGTPHSQELPASGVTECAAVCKITRYCTGFNTRQGENGDTVACQIIISRPGQLTVTTRMDNNHSYFYIPRY